MKYLLVIALTFVFCEGAAAQNKKFELQDVCGDPRVESIAFIPVAGKVIAITDGDSIVIKQPTGKLKTVHLVAIDSGSNEPVARNFLTKTLLDKKVKILISSGFADNEKVWGLVRRKGREINRRMIEQGISNFKEPAPYTFSNYSTCVYQKLEEKAKQKKVGIWAK